MVWKLLFHCWISDVKVKRDRKDYVLCILGTVSRETVGGQDCRCQHSRECTISYLF